MLGILYWGTDGFVPYQNGEPMVTLPFHAGINKADSRDFRRRYTLNIGESVLLLINVAYAGKQPIYIVIRINLQHLHGPQVREVDDSSLFEVLYIGDEKKDLTQFTEKSEGQYSEQQL